MTREFFLIFAMPGAPPFRGFLRKVGSERWVIKWVQKLRLEARNQSPPMMSIFTNPDSPNRYAR
jgi:hypothetical protein